MTGSRGRSPRPSRSPRRKPPQQPLTIPALETARQLAFAVLKEARESSRFVQDLLAARSSDGNLTTPDRRLAGELVHETVRRQITIDNVLKHFVKRPQTQVEPDLWTLLQLGACQLLILSAIPPHAAVSETVELARWLNRPGWCGFLNGVLRALSQEIDDALRENPDARSIPVRVSGAEGDSQIRYRTIRKATFADPERDMPAWVGQTCGLPAWLIERWRRRFDSDELLAIGLWFAFQQPMTIRVNALQTTRDELLNRFRGDSETPECFQPGQLDCSIRLSSPGRIPELPGFEDGLFTVQDETAMSASLLLDPGAGERVLDLCAAPGTKSTHLAELMGDRGQIIATDVSSQRLQRVQENVTRLGLKSITPVLIGQDLAGLPAGPFDAVLVDAPCSNTGVMGKRPEVRHRLTPGDIDEHAQVQQRLLSAAATRVLPGGAIVYSTCSIEPEENSGVVSSFLGSTNEFELVSAREFFPGQGGDGGYQALLRRTPA